MRATATAQERGFTLVEIAIVLTIIGLLVTGVIYGSSLVGSAREQRTIQEMLSYDQDITRFYEQYNALPGDMARADTYWGALCTPCNGNGNRQIEWNAGEGTKAWQVLALSKIINGSYTGVGANGQLGVNIPRSAYIENAGYYLFSRGVTNYIGLATATNNPGSGAGPSISPESAYKMDLKMDDGNAISGKVLSNGTNCATLTGEYNASKANPLCEISLQLKVLNR